MSRAIEMHELVEFFYDVWGMVLKFSKPHAGDVDGTWIVLGMESSVNSGGLLGDNGDETAELILEALFARSTGCGVDELVNGRFRAFDLYCEEHGSYPTKDDHPTRLHALVAAEAARRSNP